MTLSGFNHDPTVIWINNRRAIMYSINYKTPEGTPINEEFKTKKAAESRAVQLTCAKTNAPWMQGRVNAITLKKDDKFVCML
jgi:hypothetical protein